MKKLQSKSGFAGGQKGFTLVELAIVMTIIGLLIGGVLKGQQLLENARMTATIAQIKGFEAASTSFRDAYGALPGDLSAATDRLPNCGTAVDCTTDLGTGEETDDGVIGARDWEFDVAAGANVQFFGHMFKADLISGVTDAAAEGLPDQGLNRSVPEARIGGGWILGYVLNDTIDIPGGTGTNAPISGHVLSIVDLPTNAALDTDNIRPDRAAQIDRKIDDGRIDTGFVQAGADAGCRVGTAPALLYNEGNSAKACNVVIRIMG
jgi:prepilin-type N-terminal cleavage/methylation domain-containing protein